MADPRSGSPSGPLRRRSNQDRAQWRDACRQALVRYISKSSSSHQSPDLIAHIWVKEQQLDLDVDAADVRLVPGPTDPYVWQYGPEQEHLFRRQLSKHNVGAYRQICQNLGRSIQVVLRDGPTLQSLSTQDLASGKCLTLPRSRSPGSQSSQGCCGGVPGNATHGLSNEHITDLQELETKNHDLVARLEVATCAAEESKQEIQRLQASKDAMEQRLRQLEATLLLRNAEALRRTKLVEEYLAQEQSMTTLLQGWERGLRTLQVEVGMALQHRIFANNS
ncbi:hypothetical protein LTR51_008609 [Lithohypha guttulata]|nr:hypothetical protein LTR51_008609 [Lithohypha guttulata]